MYLEYLQPITTAFQGPSEGLERADNLSGGGLLCCSSLVLISFWNLKVQALISPSYLKEKTPLQLP